MKKKDIISTILENYSSENPGSKFNLYKILTSGALSGTGKLLILPVDQGFEHGPDCSFAKNPDAYDPEYHFQLSVDSGISAYAAPLGFLEASINKFIGKIPVILKLNNSNSLYSALHDQAFTGSVKDALRIGAIGIGVTIYPGSSKAVSMIEEVREVIKEAKSYGLIVIVWSYPRGEEISKEAETAIDICAYAVHIAALLGAHIIKVKLPKNYVAQNHLISMFSSINTNTLSKRIMHVMKSAFNNKRLVIFSGGSVKSEDEILKEVESIKIGGGNGSMIGRNVFQRPYNQAIKLIQSISNVYNND